MVAFVAYLEGAPGLLLPFGKVNDVRGDFSACVCAVWIASTASPVVLLAPPLSRCVERRRGRCCNRGIRRKADGWSPCKRKLSLRLMRLVLGCSPASCFRPAAPGGPISSDFSSARTDRLIDRLEQLGVVIARALRPGAERRLQHGRESSLLIAGVAR